MTFYVFLSCLTRFLEHWLWRTGNFVLPPPLGSAAAIVNLWALASWRGWGGKCPQSFRLSENFLQIWGYFGGNLGVKLKFWALTISSFGNFCSCLSEDCNFLPPSAFVSHNAADYDFMSSVRPSVCVSGRLSVRPSVPDIIWRYLRCVFTDFHQTFASQPYVMGQRGNV